VNGFAPGTESMRDRKAPHRSSGRVSGKAPAPVEYYSAMRTGGLKGL